MKSIRKDTAQRYREIRKILHQGRSEPINLPPTLLEDKKHLFSAGSFGICFLLASLVFVASCVHSTPAHAYTEQDAINAVIGEAEGEPQQGKEAVACAMHYRGYLTGVYGLRADRVIHHKYSHRTYVMAKRAVEMADDMEVCEYLVHGAQYWEGTYFPTPYWAKTMTLTAVIGHQRFYRKG